MCGSCSFTSWANTNFCKGLSKQLHSCFLKVYLIVNTGLLAAFFSAIFLSLCRFILSRLLLLLFFCSLFPSVFSSPSPEVSGHLCPVSQDTSLHLTCGAAGSGFTGSNWLLPVNETTILLSLFWTWRLLKPQSQRVDPYDLNFVYN